MNDNSSLSQMMLEPERWFGWTMYPGYAGRTYHSPIKVHRVRELGSGRIDLDFLNLGYAAGVRDMTYRLSPLGASQTRVLFFCEGSDRLVVIEPLDRGWAETRMPELHNRLRYMAADGVEFGRAMDQIVAEWSDL